MVHFSLVPVQMFLNVTKIPSFACHAMWPVQKHQATTFLGIYRTWSFIDNDLHPVTWASVCFLRRSRIRYSVVVLLQQVSCQNVQNHSGSKQTPSARSTWCIIIIITTTGDLFIQLSGRFLFIGQRLVETENKTCVERMKVEWRARVLTSCPKFLLIFIQQFFHVFPKTCSISVWCCHRLVWTREHPLHSLVGSCDALRLQKVARYDFCIVLSK